MREERLDGHHGRPVEIDVCQPCQAFWFDGHESLSLTPSSTLALFRVIGAQAGPVGGSGTSQPRCPRCRARLRRTHDMQRATRFEYLRCPAGHGRLTSFFDFLREKDFIRPLTSAQIENLRRNVQTVQCSACGGPVDVTRGGACSHCGSPLSMLDMAQAGALVAELQRAEAREREPVDPALPIEMARARREVERAFAEFERDEVWFREASALGVAGAGLRAVARWLARTP